jgi:hypothetical protein
MVCESAGRYGAGLRRVASCVRELTFGTVRRRDSVAEASGVPTRAFTAFQNSRSTTNTRKG